MNQGHSLELQLEPDWSEYQLTPDLIFETTKRFVPLMLAATILAFFLGYVAGPLMNRVGLGSSVTVGIPPLPTVGPMVYKSVSQDQARKFNAEIPMSTKPIISAAPFILFNGEKDRERAIDCLAATVYYEAGNEAIEGQMAVVQVVLNRVRHPAYPKSICGVVFQGHERRTGCQFSYTCDGSILRRRPGAEQWNRLRGLAKAMTNGLVYAPVGLATHYHTDWVFPVWSTRLEKVRVERTHLFFRYFGYWGTPKAFSGRYASSEPSFIKMSILSPAHLAAGEQKPEIANVAGEAIAAVADLPQIEPGLAPISMENVAAEITPENKGKDTFILYIDPLLEPEALTGMARNACGDHKKCKVLAWADQGLMPKGLPIQPDDRKSMAFSYQRGSGRNSERSAWNCDLFPREKQSECL